MKRFLAPILLLTLLFPAFAFGETMDDLVERDGIYYKKFTDVPFTGKTTGKYQASFRNGKKDGPWESYDENGKLESKETYKDGKEDTVVYYTYHDNGKLEYKGTFKNGKEDGPWVWYDRFGTLDEELTGTFKNGVKVK